MAGRAYVLTMFIIPKFQFLFQFEPFTSRQIENADKSLRRAFWGRDHGYLAHPQTALPRNEGSFSLPSLLAIYRATRLKQVALIARYNARRVQPPPRGVPIERIPDWVDLLMELWHENITYHTRDANNNVQLPQFLTDLGPQFLRYFLFDPFSQICDWACLPMGAWPPALQAAQRICIDSRFPQTVDFCNTLSTGSSLMRPALACSYDIRELFDGRTAENRYFFEAVALYYKSIPPLQNRPFFTIAAIETIADRLRTGAATAPTRERERRVVLTGHLVEYVNLHRGTPSCTSAEDLARPHMLNWSYGPPRTTPPPDVVVRQYAYANTANRAWIAPAPAAQPPATVPIAIPFAMWSNHGAVRRLLDGAPPLVYPSVTLS
ncbi:hypothetical protein FBU31_007077, partial [Coemansia sp. 'formosensis']